MAWQAGSEERAGIAQGESVPRAHAAEPNSVLAPCVALKTQGSLTEVSERGSGRLSHRTVIDTAGVAPAERATGPAAVPGSHAPCSPGRGTGAPAPNRHGTGGYNIIRVQCGNL